MEFINAILFLGLALIYFYMAIIVVSNTRSENGGIYIGVFSVLSIWALSVAFMLYSPKPQYALIFAMASLIFWVITYSFLLFSLLTLTKTLDKLKPIVKKIITSVIFIIPIFILLYSIIKTKFKSYMMVYTDLGWMLTGDITQFGITYYIFNALIFFFLISYFVIFIFKHKEIIETLSKKFTYLLFGAISIMVFGSFIVDALFYSKYQVFVAQIATVVLAIFPASMFFSILKKNNFTGVISTGFMIEILDKFREGLLFTNHVHTITYANKGFINLIGKDIVLGKNLMEILPIDDPSILEQEHVMELVVDNSYLQCNYSILRNQNNEIIGRFFLVQDIGEIKKSQIMMEELNRNLEQKINEATKSLTETNKYLRVEIKNRSMMSEKIKRMANYDSLTDLANRSYLRQQVNNVLMKSIVTNTTHSMLYMDLNKFKAINDTYGHIAGDKVIIEFATKLKMCFRQNGIIGRIGGDEFIVFLQNVSSRNDIITLCDNLFKLLETNLVIGKIEIEIKPSIGISIAPTDSYNYAVLLKLADKAMYHSKINGLQYTFYSDIKDKDGIESNLIQLAQELDREMEDEEYYDDYYSDDFDPFSFH